MSHADGVDLQVITVLEWQRDHVPRSQRKALDDRIVHGRTVREARCRQVESPVGRVRPNGITDHLSAVKLHECRRARVEVFPHNSERAHIVADRVDAMMPVAGRDHDLQLNATIRGGRRSPRHGPRRGIGLLVIARDETVARRRFRKSQRDERWRRDVTVGGILRADEMRPTRDGEREKKQAEHGVASKHRGSVAGMLVARTIAPCLPD